MKLISHSLPFLLLAVPLIWGLYGFFKTRGEGGSGITIQKTAPAIAIINSAVLYAIAFNIIFFIQELFLALGKRWLGLKAFLYHNNHNWEGSHPMESLAQGYGAAAIFIVGFICLALASYTRLSSHWMHVLWLWLGFQGLAQSIPQFITGKIAPDTDTGQAFTYLGIGEGIGLFISVAGVIGMLYLSMLYSSYLLRLAPSSEITGTASGRSAYLFRIAVLAAIIGLILITPFRIMPWNRAVAPVMVTLISIPMVFANAWNARAGQVINSDINHRILIVPIVLLVALLLVFQLVLAPGIAM